MNAYPFRRTAILPVSVILTLLMLVLVPAQAQHSLQTDDGNDHIGIIEGPTSGASVQVYTLPSGGGTLLTTNSGGSIPSGAYLAFPDDNSHSGFTYTGYRQTVGGNEWTVKATMPTSRYAAGSAVVSSKMYVVGGTDNTVELTANEEYDPVTNSWASKANMPTARANPGVASVGGLLYSIGGFQSPNIYHTLNEEYDPVANTWATRAAMPTARNGAEATESGGKLYLIGGNVGATYMNTNEEYTPPPGNTWAAKANMPTARGGLICGMIGDKIYCVGGEILGSNLTTNEEYDPSNNTWAARASLPVGTSRACGAASSSNLYFFTGLINNLGNHVDDTRIYTPPPVNAWTTGTSIPNMRGSATASIIGNIIYVTGGYTNNGATLHNETDAYTIDGLSLYWFNKD